MESVTLGIKKEGDKLFFTASEKDVELDRQYGFQSCTMRVTDSHDNSGFDVRFFGQDGMPINSFHLITDGHYTFSAPESFSFSEPSA